MATPVRKTSLSSTLLAKPQGAPRGLLVHYILHKIASKPSHGYEILQEIEDRTKGAWRPGPGSTYPLLKKLVQEGMIKFDSSIYEDVRRIYQITPKGLQQLNAAKQALADYGERWQGLRGLIVELIDTEHVEKFLVECSKSHFHFTREILKKNMKNVTSRELEYILKEYILSLERQLDWTRQMLENMGNSMQNAKDEEVSK
jgi:DNA-binding PadR family transcriptional regulator